MEWQDNNDNKLRDNNETTIIGIEITLYSENGELIDTLLSDDFGKYHFTYLPEGKYHVKVPSLKNKKFLLFSVLDLQTNSDFTNQNGTEITDLIQTEIG